MSDHLIDVLIPTYNRAGALAVTLTSLIAQEEQRMRVIISDQSDPEAIGHGEMRAAANVLRAHGIPVEVYRHLPRKGMAEHRQFLLNQVSAPFALFLDDDLILEKYVLKNMLRVIQAENIGFVGSAVIGLSFLDDVRPYEQEIEFWDGPVQPEVVRPDLPSWQRYRLHNAANLYHVQKAIDASPDRPLRYKVAWVGGCVLFNTPRLREVGGFSFWRELPSSHSGEDVLAQLRVMQVYGGCGLIPSGVYHQELPTTIPDRQVDAPKVLNISPHVKMN